MNVYKKLQQARLKLQATTLKKSGKNKFAGFEYFELGDFLPTIQTIFAEVGLCGTVSFGTEIATLTIVDVDATQETQPNFVVFSSPMSTAELKGCHAIQNLGAVQTYLRRYLWVAAMEIVEHDALDAVTGSDASKKASPTSEAPRIVGTPKTVGKDRFDWIIDAPAYDESDTISWLNLIQDSTENSLGFCEKIDDVMDLFKKNKVLFDKVKEVDPETFTKMMEKFTITKNKLEEKANG